MADGDAPRRLMISYLQLKWRFFHTLRRYVRRLEQSDAAHFWLTKAAGLMPTRKSFAVSLPASSSSHHR